MGLSDVGQYKRISSDNMDIQQLTLQQKLLQLKLEIIENEIKQAEMLNNLQSTREPNKTCDKNLETSRNNDALESALVMLSKCDYYHGSISWHESCLLLEHSRRGMFLVRKSQSNHPRYPFAISFQRGLNHGGAVSIRVVLDAGRWSLDCEEPRSTKMPSFASLSNLIQFYKDLPQAENCLVQLTDGLKCDFLCWCLEYHFLRNIYFKLFHPTFVKFIKIS